MSVPDQTPYIIHNANGLTTVFAFEFYIIANSDLRVAVNGTDVTSGFTVSGAGNTHGGEITFNSSPASGNEILIERKISALRLTEYQNNGDFLAETVNKDFDRIWMSNKRSEIYLDLSLQRPLTGGEYDANGFQIKNLEKPIDAGDAATKEYSDELYTDFSKKADQLTDAFNNGMYGYILIDSFQKGATLTFRNHALKDERTGEYYRWDGDWSKVKDVPANSTPESTGGMSMGAWVGVGDASAKAFFAVKSGASNIGTALGMTVEERFSLKSVMLNEYLPYNFNTTGTVDYITQIRQAINEVAAVGKMLIIPGNPFLIDIANGGSILVPSGSDIDFMTGGSLNIAPNINSGYSGLRVSGSSDVTLRSPVIYGDKLTHLADGGEAGHGIAILNGASNVRILNPEIHACWGDGIYIGQEFEHRSMVPKKIYIGNPVCSNNRRQGISIVSVDGLTIDNPRCFDTKSSDSRFPLVNGPHAGIDIEPNYFRSMLNNIRINNLIGGDNSGPLLIISLSNAAKNATSIGAEYPLDITINGMSDTSSYHGLQLLGASDALKYTGQININKVGSNKPIASGIGIRTWRNKSVPVVIDGVNITDWWSKESDIEYHFKAAIGIDRGAGSAELGGIKIKGVRLKNKSSNTSPMLIGAYNTGGQVKDVTIEVDSVDVPINTGVYEVREGDASVYNTEPMKGALYVITSNTTTSPTAVRDIHIKSPATEVTVTLAGMTDYIGKLSNVKFHVKFTPGEATTFRLRTSASTPLYVNGVKGTTFTGDTGTGLCTVEFNGYAYFVKSQGVLSFTS